MPAVAVGILYPDISALICTASASGGAKLLTSIDMLTLICGWVYFNCENDQISIVALAYNLAGALGQGRVTDKHAVAETRETQWGSVTTSVLSYSPKLLPGIRPVGNANVT